MTASPPTCPKCGGAMEQGFVYDHTYAARFVSHWAAGAPRKSFWRVTTSSGDATIPIGTFRCSACGFLEAYARDVRLGWRIDPSNEDPRYARNHIRHHTLPDLERRVAPGVRAALARLATLAAADEEAWDSLKRTVSRPFARPKSGRIAVKVINHLGDEVMKVLGV